MDTIQWLQISDIHILKRDPGWSAYQRSLFQYADSENVKPDFLVLTGDYHNIAESGFENAVDFIHKVAMHFSLTPEKDIFMIPGNHDTSPRAKNKVLNFLFSPHVSDPRKEEFAKLLPEGLKPWDKTKDNTVIRDWLTKHQASPSNYIDRLCGVSRQNDIDRNIVKLDILLSGFHAYREFVSNTSSWYQINGTDPAVPHLRQWTNADGVGFNIVHLNTAIASDGSRSHYQALDLQATATVLSQLKDDGLPTIVIAHNSFYDLHPKIQDELILPLAEAGVCAWLCGDAHRFSIEKTIRLPNESSVREVPILICGKGAPDNMDLWSNYGFFHYKYERSLTTAYLVKWDKKSGCHLVLPNTSFSTPVRASFPKKPKLLIGYLSCNPDVSLREKYHLGHALFISNMDEKIKRDTSVLLISSFVRPNRGYFGKTGNEKAYVVAMADHWRQCFNNKVSVLDITQAFETDQLDDNNGSRLIDYLTKMEMKLDYSPNAPSIQIIIQNWSKDEMITEGNLAAIKDFFELDHSKSYSTEEILSFAFLLLKKPTWYSITWLRAFLFFWNYRLYEMLYSQTGIDVSGLDIYIYEAQRNHYVWDAISYCAKRFDYLNFPRVEYFDSLLDTRCQEPMKSSSAETAFFLKDYESADTLSPDYSEYVKKMFHTDKSLKELANHYYERLGLDKVE